MFNINLPNGNGQKVYIENDWILAKDEIPSLIYISDDQTFTGRTKRKEFVEYLISMGYKVITDVNETDDDTFFLTPVYGKDNEKDYYKEKLRKIDECLKVTRVRKPKTISFPQDHFPKRTMKLPFVLKNENAQGGTEKILIKTRRQLNILKAFDEEIYDYDFEKTVEEFKQENPHLAKRVKFNSDGTSNTCWSIMRFDYKKYFYENFVLQQFIETPTKFNTSMRVLVTPSKDVLCASLKYATPEEVTPDRYYDAVDQYLLVDNNPYFINTHPIISNTVAGGRSILLYSSNYTDLEREILSFHNIDPDNPVVPEEVLECAGYIASTLKSNIGAITGIDFIYDKNLNKWFYLEEQEYPMLNTYCEYYGMDYITDGDIEEFHRTHREADFNSRLRSLSLYMKK